MVDHPALADRHARPRATTPRLGQTDQQRRDGDDTERVADDKDTVTVTPRLPLTPASIDTYEDHRMAMAFGLLTLVEPAITINDPECVTKTWPGFFAELERYRTSN